MLSHNDVSCVSVIYMAKVRIIAIWGFFFTGGGRQEAGGGKREAVWNLGIGICLDFGSWNLEFISLPIRSQ
jgi:hypothetical protein